MLRSSIDLGTNTCLLLIAQWDPAAQRVTEVVSDHSTIVRLGKGVDRDRRLDPEAMERTLSCLREYVALIRKSGLDPSSTLAVATSSSRDASNGAEFYARVEKETGLRFRTLSGDEEARATFAGGLLPGMSAESSVVIDIGGGSTELMSSRGGKSIDIGSVRFTERYLKSDPVTDEEFWACQHAIDEALEEFRPAREAIRDETGEAPHLIAVAGTATTLAAYHLQLDRYDAAAIDELTVTRGDVHRLVEELKWRTVDERKQLPGVEEGRADVLLAGSLILWRAMEVLDFVECRTSTRGLRFGVLGITS